MKNEINMIRRAIQISIDNITKGGGPFGAVIVKDGIIVGEGANQVTLGNDPTAHAEIVAIRQACKNLNNFSLEGCEIYTSCEPCPMCLSAIYWARISKIYFGNNKSDAAKINFDDNFIYQEIAKDPSERTIPMLELAREEAQKAFEIWQQKTDKTPY